jgi:AraC-like DNA-binding protein
MVMIPLPFVFSCIALWGVWRLMRSGLRDQGWHYALICLAVIAVQMAIIGVRFGYGLPGLAAVQPFVGVLVPSLIWLSFRRPISGLVHVVPALVLGVIHAVVPVWEDAFVALVALGYAGALVWLARQGEAGLAWVPTAQVRFIRGLLWAALAMLVAMGLTDALATLAVIWGKGRWIGGLVAMAMGLVAASLGLAQLLRRRNPSVAATDDYGAVFAAVERLLREDQIYCDADLTLGRIARKLHVPVKAVSRAVNAGAGMNVSQYVNGFRVRDACARLRGTDQGVTAILYEVGFNTKSNFNREFARIKGVTPSAYRRGGGQ